MTIKGLPINAAVAPEFSCQAAVGCLTKNSAQNIGRAVCRNEVCCGEVAARNFAQYVPKGVIAGGLIHG